MIYEIKKSDINVPGGYCYWSNAMGEVHRWGKIYREPLPAELESVREHLWFEPSYLAEFRGRFGLSIEIVFDEMPDNYDKLVDRLGLVFPEYDVISIPMELEAPFIAVFLPSNASAEEVRVVSDFMFDYGHLKSISFNEADEKKLKKELFMAGSNAIKDFLGYEYPMNEDKDVTERRIDEALFQITPAIATKYLLKYKSDQEKEKFRLEIKYSWGDEEKPTEFDSFSEAWSEAKRLAIDEAEITSTEHECPVELDFSSGRIILHYLYDDTYCYYNIVITR